MANTRIKICGITSVEDAAKVIEAGADAIGLVFYDPSPRAVSVDQAAEIARTVGPFVTVVGLFVNASEGFIRSVLEQVNLHVLQFHGDEPADFCRQFHRPYMKAIRMKPDLELDSLLASYDDAAGHLLDAYRPGVPGGTGEVFDWARVPVNSQNPIILAGGLTPENIASAIQSTRVYGVDVSGGVESAPGIKSADKVIAFIKNARSAL